MTLVALAGYMWLCRTQAWGLGGVWWGIVIFFGVRAAQSFGRVWFKHMRKRDVDRSVVRTALA